MVRCHLVDRLPTSLDTRRQEGVLDILEREKDLLLEILWILDVDVAAGVATGLVRGHVGRDCDDAADVVERSQFLAQAGGIDASDAELLEGAVVLHDSILRMFDAVVVVFRSGPRTMTTES